MSSRVDRRALLRASVFGSLVWRYDAWAGPTAAGATAGAPMDAFAPWLDTLIPADETPSATALGVDRAILAWARGQPRPTRLLEDGCAWLDAVVRSNGAASFRRIPATAQEAVARVAAAAEAGSLPRVFFDRTWDLAIYFYYAHPETWAALGYAGPPQPGGFPDADKAPG
jgi:hypothetical protein